MLLDGAELDAPAAPLNELLRIGLDSAPDEIAIVSVTRALTWRELDRASAALAGGYRALGLQAGDRLASLMPNRIDLVVHYLACFRAGVIATPLNYRYTAREIDHALEVSGARALLAHVERAEDIAASELAGGLELGAIAYRDAEPLHDPAATNPPGATAVGATSSARSSKPSRCPTPMEPPDPGAPAVIFFTSGSTGPAKGVTHTRETLRWMIASAAGAFELDAGDVFLPGSSMSHIGSFLWALATLSVGGKVVVARGNRRPRAPAAAARASTDDSGDDPGGALGADPRPRPAAGRLLLAADLPRRRRQGLDRASDRVRLQGGLPDRRGIRNDRGRLGDPQPALGRDQAGLDREADLRLHASPCATRRASRSRPGRSAGSGSERRSRMVGYWQAPEATEEVVIDDWLDSGDLARADEDGYLWFFGRKKQVIVHDGSNISPLRGRGRAGRAPGGRAGRRRRRSRRGPRRERARLRDPATRAPSRPRAPT